MVELVLATRNPHKLREFNRLLAPARVVVQPLPDDVELPPETGDTFAANALPKARMAAAATGRPAIADDSGIESQALGGAPGVRSARYAGEHASDEDNLRKLIAQAPPGSGLRYVCVLAYVDPTTGEGGLVEVQATAERTPLSRAHLDDLLALAAKGIEQLRAAQTDATN